MVLKPTFNIRHSVQSFLFILADFIDINIALLLAFYIRYDFSPLFYGIDWLGNIYITFLVSSVFKIMIFSAFNLYNSLWRYAGGYEAVKVVISSATANLILTAALFLQYEFTGFLSAPRSIFIITFMLDVFALGGLRMVYRFIRRGLTDGMKFNIDKVKRVLIIGAGHEGASIAKEMKTHSEHNMKPVAFLDKDPYKIGCKINGIKILAEQDQLDGIVKKERINEIIIALPHADAGQLNQVYAKASATGCRIKILPSMTQIIGDNDEMQKVKDVQIEDLLGREPVELDTQEMDGFIRDKKILVTGAGGSIGSEICRQIALYNPKQLIMLDNYENNLFDLLLELGRKYHELHLEPVIANIREEKRIANVFVKFKPDIVFHAAAHKHVPFMEGHPEEAIKNNVLGTWNVAHAADKAGVGRFVLISSDKAVNPANVMGATKRIAEMIIQAINTKSKTEFMAVRFGNVLGSNGSVIPIFKRQIEAGGPVTVTHPEMTRYFMTIPEAAQLVIQAGAFAKGGEIFILDMGKPVKIIDLAENMIRLSGLEPYREMPIEFIGLRPGEKLYEELLLSEEGIQKTKNDKIFVASPLFTDYALLKRKIEYIRQSINTNFDDITVKEYIKDLVPNFIQDRQVG